MAERRRSARVLLVDDDRCVLLFEGIDRTKPEVDPWWFPVGGGVDVGESVEVAAIREVREETGLEIDDPGPVVFERRFTWDFEGAVFDQQEWFFLVRTTRFEPSRAGWTSTEQATMTAYRWWSVDEIRNTTVAVFPEDLAERLDALLG